MESLQRDTEMEDIQLLFSASSSSVFERWIAIKTPNAHTVLLSLIT